MGRALDRRWRGRPSHPAGLAKGTKPIGVAWGERPCPAGIRRERVEAPGGGRPYDLDCCGRLGRRDERAQVVLRYIPRSLVSAPAVHHSVSRWRWPAAGWGDHTEEKKSVGWVGHFQLTKWVKWGLALTLRNPILMKLFSCTNAW